MFQSAQLQSDFPILSKKIHGKRLVYLDNAATSQKPRQVIEAIVNYYEQHNANVHRGVHQLSEESTQVWEDSREIIADFLGADNQELILTRNTTEAINGVAYGWALDHIKKDELIITTEMEHHSDVVPWQEIAKRTGATLHFVKVDQDGRLDLEHLKSLLTDKVKLVALSYVSNTLGTRNPLEKIVEIVKKHSQAKVLVDGAQAAPHIKVDFHKLNIDFFIFSGHKMLGPMGVGGLIVKKELLSNNEVKPWLFGGGMIEAVYTDRTTFHEDPQERFTAGTPDVASAVGLAAACRYLENLGISNVEEQDRELVEYAIEQLSKIREVKLIGPTTSQDSEKLDRVGSVAFLYEGVHPHDVAQILDSEGIAVRSGHHCTMPLHNKFGWPGTLRASFQVYNTKEDIDALITALAKVKTIFRK